MKSTKKTIMATAKRIDVAARAGIAEEEGREADDDDDGVFCFPQMLKRLSTHCKIMASMASWYDITAFWVRLLTELCTSMVHFKKAFLDDVSTVGAMARQWVAQMLQGSTSARAIK